MTLKKLPFEISLIGECALSVKYLEGKEERHSVLERLIDAECEIIEEAIRTVLTSVPGVKVWEYLPDEVGIFKRWDIQKITWTKSDAPLLGCVTIMLRTGEPMSLLVTAQVDCEGEHVNHLGRLLATYRDCVAEALRKETSNLQNEGDKK